MTNHEEGKDLAKNEPQIPPLGLKPSVGMTNHEKDKL
jgi:hypothetical protein